MLDIKATNDARVRGVTKRMAFHLGVTEASICISKSPEGSTCVHLDVAQAEAILDAAERVNSE